MRHRRSNKRLQKTTVIIGVLGACRGVGVTHICILLAEYAAMHEGAWTALIEFNDHMDFQKMEEELYEEGRQYFSCHEVDYYGNCDKILYESVMKKGYSYIIIDFGESLIGKKQEMDICHKKLLIGSNTLWKRAVTQRKENFFVAQGWIYLENLCETELNYCPLLCFPNKKVQTIFEDILYY